MCKSNQGKCTFNGISGSVEEEREREGQAVTLHFKTTAIKVLEIEKSTVSKSADADGD